MTAYAFFILALAVLAPLPWIGIYHLDRRCATARGAGDLGPKGKRAEPAETTSLAVADRRPSRAPDQAATALGQPGPGGPM